MALKTHFHRDSFENPNFLIQGHPSQRADEKGFPEGSSKDRLHLKVD